MKRENLNFCFHNPNKDGLMEKYIFQVVVEQKVNQLLRMVRDDSHNEEDKQAEWGL